MKIDRVLEGSLFIFRHAVSMALLIFFLLPHTFWSILSPLSISPVFYYGGFSYNHALVVSIVVLAIWFSYRQFVRHEPVVNMVWWLSLLYLAAFSTSCFKIPLQVYVIGNCTLVMLSFGVGLLGARLCGSSNLAGMMLAALGTVQASYAFFNFLHGEETFLSGTVVRASGTLGSPLILATMMLICLPIALDLALKARNTLVMAIWMIAVAVMFAALLLTGTRGAMIALAPALIWMVWRISKNWTIAAAVGTVILMLCFSVFTRRSNGSINQGSTNRSTQGHITLMQGGWKVFQQHWLTGTGAGSLEIMAPVQKSGVIRNQMLKQPKNLALQWLAEFGIGGGVLLLAFLIGITRIIKGSSAPDAVGIGGAWLALFTAGIFDTPFGSGLLPNGNALVGVLLGATLLLPVKRSDQLQDS